jgi:lipopolysaccharide/colanic/teichoic acid biosynthesis glycosyltransferase
VPSLAIWAKLAIWFSEEFVVSSVRLHNIPKPINPLLEPLTPGEREVFSEGSFKRMIALERKRSERSQEPFLLMLVEVSENPDSPTSHKVLDRMISVLMNASRDTDIVGWYRERATLGVVFTELITSDRNLIRNTILARVSALVREELDGQEYDKVSISFHFFPDEWDHAAPDGSTNTTLYPDLMDPGSRKKSLLMIKRALDIAISALVILILSPVYAVIALAIKLTSDGPVLFRQQRVGQYGKLFTVLKFRSMKVNSDQAIHKDYVMKLIKNQAEPKGTDNSGKGVYKVTSDHRITRTGQFLRRTSLDELPQFFNVLKGDMSLVGPRPPIPYELAAYQTWHRRRILEAKPGVTGLWQVTGRSSVKFDDMVRLDLRYATSWTLWMDIKILLMTPLAVIKGAGAY